MISRAVGVLSTLTCLLAAGAAAQQPPPVVGGGSPAVSPDGRWIAFGSNRDGQDDLYLIAPDGTAERRLTNTPEREGLPAWSRDGREVRFGTGGRDSTVLMAVSVADGSVRKVARVAGRGAVLSPDGRLVLASVGAFTGARLVITGLDGSGPRYLTDSTSSAFNASWSPDGRQVAYSRLAGDRSISVWVINADGTGARQVTHLEPGQGRAQWPAWSADGRRLAVQVGQAGGMAGNAHIAVVDLASGSLTPLAPHATAWLDETPSWLPDGRIAFQSDRGGRMEVWIMHADGTGAMPVTRRP